MNFIKTKLQGVYEIVSVPITDYRGYFTRTFCVNEFKDQNINLSVVQINRSMNIKKGTIRGMHYQKEPMSEDKVVSIICGSIYDVIVDLRPKSKTYKQWIAIKLSDKDNRMIFIPKGCAHGFQTLEDNCIVEYFMSEFYSPQYASGVRPDDPAFKIKWPIKQIIISDKDKNWPQFQKE